MKMLVEIFLNQSFGKTAGSARTAALNEPIAFQAKHAEPGYTSVAGAKGNLR